MVGEISQPTQSARTKAPTVQGSRGARPGWSLESSGVEQPLTQLNEFGESMMF